MRVPIQHAGRTILVVDDEIQVADMLQRALEALGNRCVVAGNAADAEALLAEHSVDAVTLDLGMPGGDGLSWLESVARTRPQLARRTLVITGRPLEADSISRLAACGAGVLAKPFTLESLNEAVRAQIDHLGGAGARIDRR